MKKFLVPMLCMGLSVLALAACDAKDGTKQTSYATTTQNTGVTTVMTTRATTTQKNGTTGGGVVSDVSEFFSDLVTDATDLTEPAVTTDAADSSGGAARARNRDVRSDDMGGSRS